MKGAKEPVRKPEDLEEIQKAFEKREKWTN